MHAKQFEIACISKTESLHRSLDTGGEDFTPTPALALALASKALHLNRGEMRREANQGALS